MRLLLDSHTVIWAADDPTQLSVLAQQLIQDPSHDRLISAATIWEMAIKFGLKKLPLSLPYRQWMDKAIADLGLIALPITLDHAERHAGLPWHHRDPFDRLLAAQALMEGIPLLSADKSFDPYGVTRLWM
ncbi:MAG: type II toxin-antitoxin system VapC family toxin [Planctomycetota bacterium]|nr:type II toxin-antitoxin system VapC family toxin [Planctomycetota bacterium]